MTRKRKSRFNYFLRTNGKDYLRTFMTTCLIVGIFGLLNIFYMIYSIFNENAAARKKFNVDSAFESYLVDILIEKNNEFAVQLTFGEYC